MNQIFTDLEEVLKYTFQNKLLLKTSLTHKSYFHEKKRDKTIVEHNERLEFLGDAVLELVVTEHLYEKFSEDEGHLTALRAALVNYRCIGEVGMDLGLEHVILLSKNEREELGKARLSIVADAVEAVIGAIHLDGGYEPAAKFIHAFILPKLQTIIDQELYIDAKTKLQEEIQRELKVTPRYKILSSTGKDHEKVFESGVYIDSTMLAKGEGASKQESEVNAARNALDDYHGDFSDFAS
jgi:ribonuclease-3